MLDLATKALALVGLAALARHLLARAIGRFFDGVSLA